MTGAAAGHASGWRTIENTDDGIRILQKESSGALVAFRGIGVVEAPLPLVATVIFDTSRRREWIKGLVDSRILRWKDKNSFIEYDHIGMPIFFTDRDFVSHVTMSFEPAGKEMTFHYRPASDPAAPRTDYIRGDLIDTTFVLRPVDNGEKTRVDAEFLCDPKGMIPGWIVNFFLKDWPKTTFRNLRKEMLKSGLSVDPRFSGLYKIIGR
jgi:START domain